MTLTARVSQPSATATATNATYFLAVLQPEPVPVRVRGPRGEGGVPAGGAAQDVGRGQLPLPVRRELQRVLHRTLLRQHRQMQVRERWRDGLIIGEP